MLARTPLLLALLIAPLASAQTVTLTPYPADGTFDVYSSLTMDMTITVEPDELTPETMEAASQQQEVVNAAERYGTLEVESVGGGHALRYVEDRVVVEATSPLLPAPMRYDSDAPDGASPQLAAAGMTVGVPMELTASADGLAFANRDAYLDALVGEVPDEQLRAQQRAALEAALVDAQVAALAGTADLLPAGPVGVGDTWDVAVPSAMPGVAAEMTGTMTVTAVDGTGVTFQGPVALAGTMTQMGATGSLRGEGTLVTTLDTATGASESTSEMALSASVAAPAAAGVEGTIQVAMDVTSVNRRSPR